MHRKNHSLRNSVAEWSTARALSGGSPQGRGFEPSSCHYLRGQLCARPLSTREACASNANRCACRQTSAAHHQVLGTAHKGLCASLALREGAPPSARLAAEKASASNVKYWDRRYGSAESVLRAAPLGPRSPESLPLLRPRDRKKPSRDSAGERGVRGRPQAQ